MSLLNADQKQACDVLVTMIVRHDQHLEDWRSVTEAAEYAAQYLSLRELARLLSKAPPGHAPTIERLEKWLILRFPGVVE